jgi:hypothetical protein
MFRVRQSRLDRRLPGLPGFQSINSKKSGAPTTTALSASPPTTLEIAKPMGTMYFV